MLSEYHVILLAGGYSSRTSIPKGLMEIKGRPWLYVQQEALKSLELGSYSIVLGALQNVYEPYIKKVFTKVVNPQPQRGPFSSLVCALKALHECEKGVFVLPLDVPCPSKKVWTLLTENLKNRQAVMPSYHSKGGHPVLLSTAFVKKLIEIPMDSTDARLDTQLHHLKADEIARVEVEDPTVTMNLNTDAAFKDYSNQCVS